MGKKWKLTAVVLSAALLACACGKQADSTEEPQGKAEEKMSKEDIQSIRLQAIDPAAYGNIDDLQLEPGTYLSIIGKAADGAFWKDVKAGAEKAVSEINQRLGYEGSDKVKVVYSGPSETDDVDEQVNILDEELARYPDALGISIVDAKSCDVQFDLAAENGIPIVMYDSASSYQNVMAKVGTEQVKAAQEAADQMAMSMENKGEVLIFAHDSRSDASRQRVDAFTQKMQAEHPEIKVGNTYYLEELENMKQVVADEINAGTYAKVGEEPKSNTDEETKIKPEELTDEDVLDFIFAKNPEATAVYGTSGSAVMAAVEGCDRLKKEEMVIAGFDAGKDEVKALKEGKITGFAAQNPFGMGYASVVACARSVLGLGNEAEVNTGYVWVTKDNLEEPEIAAMLY